MPLSHFALDQLPEQPWKNGGGTTCELACWPPGASMQEFGARISIARIAQNGPFSRFEGVARSIMLLQGDGVHLHSEDGTVDHRLDAPLAPFAFDGSLPLTCTMLGGPSRDFNVMVRQGHWQAKVDVLHGGQAHTTIELPQAGLLLAWQGEWQLTLGKAEATTLAPQQGLWWSEAPQRLQCRSHSPHGSLIAVLLEKLS